MIQNEAMGLFHVEFVRCDMITGMPSSKCRICCDARCQPGAFIRDM